jgi:hypothetical protein
MRFEELSYTSCFEAVWACASLLHLPKAMLDSVLRRFAKTLVPRGVMFASVQVGEGELLAHDGRFFAYYAKTEFVGAITAAGFKPTDVWVSEDALPGRRKVSWLNVIARATHRSRRETAKSRTARSARAEHR